MRCLCAVATQGKATGRRVSGNGVASYATAYALLWAETLFRPYNSANVGGRVILCKQSVPRAERASYARLPVAFPSVTPVQFIVRFVKICKISVRRTLLLF